MRLANFVAALLGLFAFSPIACALVVQGYQSIINERFDSGFPSSPVANTSPSFALAGYDLSGVGWRDNDSRFAITLISPEHFLTAAHVAPSAGSTVSFLGADGIKRTYTVSSSTTLTYQGRDSDLSIGRLTQVVDTNHITSYNGIFLGNISADYEGLPVTFYGKNGRVGTNMIEAVFETSLLPFGAGNDNLVDSVLAAADFDDTTGEAQGEVGDSGSPTFVRLEGGQLALFGVHSAIGTSNGVQYTYDSLPVFTAYGQINSALQADGYSGWSLFGDTLPLPGIIPEPASTATLAGGFVFLIAATRRRAVRTQAVIG